MRRHRGVEEFGMKEVVDVEEEWSSRDVVEDGLKGGGKDESG